jgi:rubrerythrin
LSEGERVVTSGQFMLDSESQLREAIAKMTGPQPADEAHKSTMEPAAHEGHDDARHPAEKLSYVCPMPEHVSVLHDAPGKCPICGMDLVPVGERALAKLIPEGRVEYYTCPMPEHSSVHEARPGKCPQCGMTLIPVMEMPEPSAPASHDH